MTWNCPEAASQPKKGLTKEDWCSLGDFIFIFFFVTFQSLLFSLSHFHSGEQSAVCSIGRFYDIVLRFCTVPTAESQKWLKVNAERLHSWPGLTCVAATLHLTHHALSWCHMTIPTNAHWYTAHLLQPDRCSETDLKGNRDITLPSGFVLYWVTLHCISLLWQIYHVYL